MEKKLCFEFSDNDNVSRIVLDLPGVVAWIEGDLEGLKESDTEDYEYTIKPIWLTDEEYEDLPEACL